MNPEDEQVPYQGEKGDRRRKAPLDKAAQWKRDNAALRSDPSFAKQWVIDENRRGKKRRKWAKGEVVDTLDDKDLESSHLRAMYKRPRFGWKEVQKDDLSMEALDQDLPAIGFGQVWLSKYLAHTRACARRQAAELVLQGRIQLNGQVVQDIVTKIDPQKDEVTLDGRPVKLRTLGELVWIMLYKPKGVISSVEDPLGRKTLMDLVPFAKEQRLVPVGRIDSHGSGLILLTNDYEWHSILTHPRYEHARRFNVQVYGGNPDRTKIVALQKGLELPDEARTCLPLKDIEVSKSKKHEGVHHISFTMHEGRYRQIQRMFEYIGHPVKSMKRTGFGLVPLDKKIEAW